MHVYLSPHLDDAALSCGGMIHRQRQRGEAVLVVTAGTAAPAPGQPLSELAQDIHSKMGNPADLIAVRRAEDEAAMERLGARFVHLGWQDAIYRGRPESNVWYYPTMGSLFGSVLHDEEREVPAVLAVVVQEMVEGGRPTRVYAPLGVGGHVDHVLAHRAAWQLYALGWPVAFYEDVPYAEPGFPHPLDEENESTIESVVDSLDETLDPELHPLDEADLEARIQSVLAYGSQVPMLYGSDEDAAARIQTFACRFDGRQPAERLWVPA